MSGGYNLLAGSVSQPSPPVMYATVSGNQPLPVSFNDPLYVVEPHRPQVYRTLTRWVAGSLPVAGASVLMLCDNYNQLVGIVGAQDAPPVAPSDTIIDPSGHGTVDWAVVKEAPLNVQWAEFGATGIAGEDAAAGVNAAVAVAAGASGSNSANVSGSGEIYLPPGIYDMISAPGIQTTNPVGLTIKGAGPQATMIRSKASGAPVAIDIDGGSSSGAANKVAIRDLMVMYQTGSSGATAIRIWDVLFFQISNCEIYANGIAVNIQGSGMGSIRDSQMYVSGPTAGPVAALWVGNGASAPGAGDGMLATYSGPITVDDCQLAADSCVTISVDACFNFRMEGGQLGNTNALATVEVDGQYTTATFEDVHAESTWDPTNAGTDFLVGSHSKAAGFHLINPTLWGQGDGTNWRKEAVSLVGCRNTKVEGALFSKLAGSHGFDGGAIHLLSGCFVTGDVAIFQCNTKDITAPLYQDDNGIVSTSYLGDYIWQHQTVENGT